MLLPFEVQNWVRRQILVRLGHFVPWKNRFNWISFAERDYDSIAETPRGRLAQSLEQRISVTRMKHIKRKIRMPFFETPWFGKSSAAFIGKGRIPRIVNSLSTSSSLCLDLASNFQTLRINVMKANGCTSTTAQAVNRWLLTANDQVRSQFISCWVCCCGQSGIGTSFVRVNLFLLPIFIPPTTLRTN
jgi:hypothetical protein